MLLLNLIKIIRYQMETTLWFKETLIIVLYRNNIINKTVVNKIIINHKHSMISLGKENKLTIMYLLKVKTVEYLM